MIIFSRGEDESICIGESITITVLEIEGSAVSLGIDAPHGYSVWRTELQTEDESLLDFDLNWDRDGPGDDCSFEVDE